MDNKYLKNFRVIGMAVVTLALLSACETASRAISGQKKAPDEFAVFARPPLSLPPEYNLRPPSPDQKKLRGVSPESQARQTLLGEPKNQQAAGSDGVQNLLENTGANKATPGIRTLVDEESTIVAKEDERFIDKLIFWVDDKPYQGTVVDPDKEQKRLQENQALGKSVTDGEIPQIKRKRAKKGLLEF